MINKYNSEIVWIFINIDEWKTFNLNLMKNNPTKLKINSILITSGNGDIYSIKIPFLTFNLYSFDSNLNFDNLDIETNIPHIINNGWYNMEINNVTSNNNVTGYIIIYMTFYYD